MPLIDLSALPQLERLIDTLLVCANHLNRIATAMESFVEIPAMPPSEPSKLTPDKIASYGSALLDADTEDDLRERLRKQGFSEEDIDKLALEAMFSEDDG